MEEGEFRGVVEEFREGVDDSFGRVSDHGEGGGRVAAHALVVADTGHGAAEDALHGNGAGPASSAAGPGEHRDAVGDPSSLGSAVVQVHEVAKDVSRGGVVAVALLHFPQVGGHRGGDGLDSSGRGGAGRHGGSALAFAARDFGGHGFQHGAVDGVDGLVDAVERGGCGRS